MQHRPVAASYVHRGARHVGDPVRPVSWPTSADEGTTSRSRGVAREGAPPDAAWRTPPRGAEEAPALTRTEDDVPSPTSPADALPESQREAGQRQGAGVGHLLRPTPSTTATAGSCGRIQEERRQCHVSSELGFPLLGSPPSRGRTMHDADRLPIGAVIHQVEKGNLFLPPLDEEGVCAHYPVELKSPGICCFSPRDLASLPHTCLAFELVPHIPQHLLLRFGRLEHDQHSIDWQVSHIVMHSFDQIFLRLGNVLLFVLDVGRLGPILVELVLLLHRILVLWVLDLGARPFHLPLNAS